MQEKGSSDNHQVNNLKVVINFANFLGPNITFYNISKKEQITSFLNTKIKNSDIDPDKRWITTWTAIFFGGAGIAALVGLSPIVGAFAIGMAVASTRLIKQVEEYVHKLQIIFAPLFFAIIGAQVDLRGINLDVLLIAGILVLIAIVTKLVGCGLPSLVFLKDKSKAMKVGIGMISRGEVGLIVAGIGATSGVLSRDVYTAIIVMVAVTTIITPIWIKKAYQKELTT